MDLFDFVGDLFGGAIDMAGDVLSSDLFKYGADAIGVGTTGIPWGSIASAGAGLLGNAASGGFNYAASQSNSATSAAALQAQIEGQRETNALNVAEAQKNRDFQTNMSSTAHQREIADLSKAGLNPLLSSKLGGSSSPTGSLATLLNPYAGSAGDTNAAIRINSNERAQIALQMAEAFADIANKNSATKLNQQNTIKSQYEGLLADSAATLNQQKQFTEIATQNNLQANTNLGEKRSAESEANTSVLTQKALTEIIQQDVLRKEIAAKQMRIELNSAQKAQTEIQTKIGNRTFEGMPSGDVSQFTNSANALSGSVGNIFDAVGSGADLFKPWGKRK
ncbi:MAG: DNA pilot protein [Microvirus sp.]|nr:MAG: DNA pilot protein [Microvirus sp.]